MTNKDKFKDTYKRALERAVEALPGRYEWAGQKDGYQPVRLCIVANSMFKAIEKDRFSPDSPALRITCKELGIENTRDGILDYWHS